MLKQMYFSIIIPALNEEKYLPKLLEDLVKQTNTNFEVIVVDGNSEDATVAKCKEFENKLPSLEIVITKKRNVSHQRNLGVEKAKANWIVFMDADDRLPVYFLDGIKYRILKEKPGCFTTYCADGYGNTADNAIIKFINLGMEMSRQLESPLAFGSMIGVKKNLFEKYGGFDVNMAFAEDSEYVKRLFKQGVKYKIFRDPRYVYSLRHYKRDGKLKFIGNTARLNLKNLAGLKIDQVKEYPMGGAYGEKRAANGLSIFLKEIKIALKKPKLLKKIKKYLSSPEVDY